jgi:hypothetical protein
MDRSPRVPVRIAEAVPGWRLLLLLGRRALHFLATALYILSEAFHRVASSKAKRYDEDAQYGNDFFHGFSFLVKIKKRLPS